MLDYLIDTSKVEARFNAMTKRISDFGAVEMPQELTAWQADDMHRSYPETKVEHQGSADEISATTDIFPRSRTYAAAHPHRVYSPRKPLSAMPRLIRASMMRNPILRPELFDKLVSRMSALLQDKLKWP